MNEAPKKIWMADECKAWAESDDIFHIPYIRADLVDELVEALKFLLTCKHGEFCDHYKEAETKARTVLAKLEENEDEVSPELREGMRKWAEARAINGLKELWRKKE